jgi:hypothetical protein
VLLSARARQSPILELRAARNIDGAGWEGLAFGFLVEVVSIFLPKTDAKNALVRECAFWGFGDVDDHEYGRITSRAGAGGCVHGGRNVTSRRVAGPREAQRPLRLS